MKRRITPAQRKRQDYLRQRGLQTSLSFERKLLKLRNAEVRRVLALCKEHYDKENWEAVIQGNLQEDYLLDWETSLFAAVGMPMAKSTARDMSNAKAAADEALWQSSLNSYAKTRAGQNIVLVRGTLLDELTKILREEMEADPVSSVEKLTKNIYSGYQHIAKWQVRRIAQTESMIGMADAANVAAKTLDVGYTKIWTISGLGNTRDSHVIMDGIEVDQDEPFETLGGLLQYPHDTSLGAEAAEIINCACACIRRPK